MFLTSAMQTDLLVGTMSSLFSRGAFWWAGRCEEGTWQEGKGWLLRTDTPTSLIGMTVEGTFRIVSS